MSKWTFDAVTTNEIKLIEKAISNPNARASAVGNVLSAAFSSASILELSQSGEVKASIPMGSTPIYDLFTVAWAQKNVTITALPLLLADGGLSAILRSGRRYAIPLTVGRTGTTLTISEDLSASTTNATVGPVVFKLSDYGQTVPVPEAPEVPDPGTDPGTGTGTGTGIDPSGIDPPMGWTKDQVGALTFREEFNELALKPAKWKSFFYYQPEQEHVDNFNMTGSELLIWNTRINGSWVEGRVFNTGGDGPGRERFAQKYGFFEIECQLPKGPSNWPAFWLLKQEGDQRPEIDVMEFFGGDVSYNTPSGLPFNYASTVHDGTDGNTTNYGSVSPAKKGITGLNLTAGMHKYGCKWDPSGIEFRFDVQSIGFVNHDVPACLYGHAKQRTLRWLGVWHTYERKLHFYCQSLSRQLRSLLGFEGRLTCS